VQKLTVRRLSYILLTFTLLPTGQKYQPGRPSLCGQQAYPEQSLPCRETIQTDQHRETAPVWDETPVSSSLFFGLQLQIGDKKGDI
jgi:hypothetical protein